MAEVRVRGVKGGPFGKLVDREGRLKIDRALLDRLGQAIVDQIVIEAKKDFAKQGKRGRRGEP
jgi:hypothetical protein